MGRRKKEDVEQISDSHGEFVYCSTLTCKYTECSRHNVNAPWDIIIRMHRFKPDETGYCKDKIT